VLGLYGGIFFNHKVIFLTTRVVFNQKVHEDFFTKGTKRDVAGGVLYALWFKI